MIDEMKNEYQQNVHRTSFSLSWWMFGIGFAKMPEPVRSTSIKLLQVFRGSFVFPCWSFVDRCLFAIFIYGGIERFCSLIHLLSVFWLNRFVFVFSLDFWFARSVQVVGV